METVGESWRWSLPLPTEQSRSAEKMNILFALLITIVITRALINELCDERENVLPIVWRAKVLISHFQGHPSQYCLVSIWGDSLELVSMCHYSTHPAHHINNNTLDNMLRKTFTTDITPHTEELKMLNQGCPPFCLCISQSVSKQTLPSLCFSSPFRVAEDR